MKVLPFHSCSRNDRIPSHRAMMELGEGEKGSERLTKKTI